MSAHKPRRKRENGGGDVVYAPPASVGTSIGANLDVAPFTLAQLLASGRRVSQVILVLIVISVAVLFRWTVGFWGYSGQGIEPMHGDFEAQRHWMEITSHLPAAQWYFYDLKYWGLDYPPLTAYHSWLLGKIGSLFNQSWFALDTSRGFESDDLTLYMRASVIVSELVLYVPAAVAVCRRLAGIHGSSKWEASIAFTALLMQPGTLLIDHGHFQYNTVMLGLVLAAIASWTRDRYAAGCAFFVGALAFKQMALYYAPVVFAYLLGSCIFPRLNLTRFLIVASSTAFAFAAVWSPLLLGALYAHNRDPGLIKTLEPPFLLTSIQNAIPALVPKSGPLHILMLHLTQSLHRIFPLARGIFEDKVANVWLTIHTAYKLNKFPVDLLSKVSLLSTLAAVFPSSVIIFLRPRKSLLPLALAASAWSFFLLSFQVHEKSVLLPLLPMTLLLAAEPNGLGPETRAWVTWANVLGTWTMYPLLKRDGQALPYAAVVLLYTVLMDVPPLRWELYRVDKNTQRQTSDVALPIHVLFYLFMGLWHWCDAFIPPPTRKPDLWVVINCVAGTAGFIIAWIYCNGMLVYRSGLLDRWLVATSATSTTTSSSNNPKSRTTTSSAAATTTATTTSSSSSLLSTPASATAGGTPRKRKT